MEARSFSAMPITLERKSVAQRSISPMVVPSMFFGDMQPALESVPTPFTSGSSVQ